MDSETIHLGVIPYIPLIVAVISVVGMGLFGVWNRRRGNVEIKAPSTSEAWSQAASANAQLDIERTLRRWYETWFWKAVAAFSGYAKRAAEGGSLELVQHEIEVLEATPPSAK